MKCSSKQYNLLHKYISDENILKLENQSYNSVCNFIDLIIKTSSNHFLSRSILKCLDFKIKYIEADRNKLNTLINNKKDYKYNYSFKIPNDNIKYHIFTKIDYVGHKNIQFPINIILDDNGNNYIGDFNILIKLHIYNIIDFMTYLKNNTF